jgi:osmotically-inducible protein OsmY
MFLNRKLSSSVNTLLCLIAGGSICLAASAVAQNVRAPDASRLESIVVTAKRRSDPVADEKMKTQVEEAMHSDPVFYDEHVTVTVKNGVATLSGMVFDDWDMRQAMRISRRIAGVKRVINDLEMVQRSSD